MEFGAIKDRRQSEFNDAIGRLQRINTSLFLVMESKNSYNAFGWFTALGIFSDEIYTEMKEPDETTSDRNQMININNILSDISKQKNRRDGDIPFNLMIALKDYERFLRKIYDKSGLQGRLIDEAANALR